MADAFDLATARQRQAVVAVLIAYVALVVVDLATSVAWAAGGSNLVLAALAVPGSLFVIRRSLGARATDTTVLAAAVAFLVAGLAIGYEGLAAFELVPGVDAIELVGTLALFAALILYFLGQR